MVVMVASNACAAKCWFGATALPASVSTYTEKFGPDAADLPAQPSHTLRDRMGRTMLGRVRDDRQRVAWNRPPTTPAGAMSVACLLSAAPTAAPTNSRATDPTGTTSDEPDDEKQNNATYAGVDGSY